MHGSPGILAGTIVILVLLLFSAMMSAAEIAFFSLDHHQAHDLRTKQGRSDRLLLSLLERPERLMATLLISRYFFNVGIVILSTYLFNSLFTVSEVHFWPLFFIQLLIMALLLILTREIVPKIFVSRHYLRFARFISPSVKLLATFWYPLSSLLVKSTNHIDKSIKRSVLNASINELSHTLDLAPDINTTGGETKILKEIAKLGDIEVKEIMKSRVDITAVEMSAKYKDLLKLIIDSGYSRIPVYEDNFDQIKGILYIKDLLPHVKEKDDYNWNGLLREALFVPENKKINHLLQEFLQNKVHMAVIVDEYGGTSGIVTLEDIIEEIVGEISDEHDELTGDVEYSKLDDRNYIFEGKTSINDLIKILGLEDDTFDDVRGDADSLAGLILELMQKMPERDEKVTYDRFIFTVKAADKRRIKKVKVTLRDNENEATSES